MTPGTSDHGLARVEGQHPDVFPSSPNALLGVFVSIMQACFYAPSRPDHIPWFWDLGPTPTTDDSGSPDDEENEVHGRRLYVSTEALEYPDARNVRPAILVGRAEIQFISLGATNAVEVDFPRMGQVLYCHANVPITLACLSRDSGESATLADVVASFLIGSCQELREAFGLHGIGMPVISTTTTRRFGAEAEFWETQVRVLVEVKYKWIKWPLAPVISEIVARLTANGEVRDLREVLQSSTP